VQKPWRLLTGLRQPCPTRSGRLACSAEEAEAPADTEAEPPLRLRAAGAGEPWGTSRCCWLRHGLAPDRELAGRLAWRFSSGLSLRGTPTSTAWVVEKLVGLDWLRIQILSSPLLRAAGKPRILPSRAAAPRLKQTPGTRHLEADPLRLLLPWLGRSLPLPGWRRLCLVGH